MTATLTAWSIARYGAPDQLVRVSRPMPTPGPGEVLIRIRASAVTRADSMMRAGQPRFARLFLGLRRPRQKLSGTGLSGEVFGVGFLREYIKSSYAITLEEIRDHHAEDDPEAVDKFLAVFEAADVMEKATCCGK